MVVAFSSYLPLTPLLGREAELETSIQRLTTEQVRLLTLVGPAGVGKTRLALEVRARLEGQFRDGTALADLAPVHDPRQVLPALAQALGLSDTGTRPPMERLQEYLRERELLLILDNFEQVLPAATQLPELLVAAPGLRLLVTSRVPLRLRWQQTLRLYPLPVPDLSLPMEELLRNPSVALFVERARAQRSDFLPTERTLSLIIQLVRQLDGLPLAIELAAGQLNVLPLPVIVRRLEKRLQSLKWEARDLPERQRSLQAAIGWSYELLPEEEQRLFRHLGVFVGRVTLAAMAAVVGDEEGEETLAGLIALAEKSLILPARLEEQEEEPAFGMLETVREYASEQLAAQGELEAAERAHAAYYIALAEEAEPRLRSREQLVWSRRLEAEHDNLRAGLRRLLNAGADERALRLAGALGHFWWLRDHYTEGGQWLEEALRTAPDADPAIRTRALLWAGLLLGAREDRGPSMAALQQALALARASSDRPSIALALVWLGTIAAAAGSLAEGERLQREALVLSEELGDEYYIAFALVGLAHVAHIQGRYQEAVDLLSAALPRFQAIGEIAYSSNLLFSLALARTELGDRAAAVPLVQQGLQRSLRLQERWLVSMGAEAALLLLGASGDVARRAQLLGARDALARATGLRTGLFEAQSRLSVATPREQIEREGLQAAYRAGRLLSLEDAAALALDLLEELGAPPVAGRQPPEPASTSPLTAREQEVLRLVAEGLTSKQIGQRLFLSPRTIDHHLTAIFNKLGVESRPQAVATAARRGLL